MYVTRPLSLYRKSPEAVSQPPDGPNSGYLVLFDEESDAEARCCFGLCADRRVRDLPFPQNKMLKVQYEQNQGETSTVYTKKAFFIPVLGKPLSSNLYYVVYASGKLKGQVCTCSREEDMATCCFCKCVKDIKPRPFDHRDVYQQVQIAPRRCSTFTGVSAAPDGFPPSFLRRRGWDLYASTRHDFQLADAHGIEPSLRARHPEFDFPADGKRSNPSLVGKWYCPFMFIKEMSSLEEQMKKSMFYEVQLVQFWEEIYALKNNGNEGRILGVKATVAKEAVTLFGEEPVDQQGIRTDDSMIWFRSSEHGSKGSEVGLSLAVVERMKWESRRGGWDGRAEGEVLKLERVEEFGGIGRWNKFGCYVLVERFAFKRMDGTLVLSYAFRHTHNVNCKWEED